MATSVLTAKATIKAVDIIEEVKQEKGDELTTLDLVKATAPVYISPILVGIGTIACFWGANIISKRNQASLMSAYALLDNSYKEYKKKVKELYGEETHNNIVDSIAKEKCKDVYISSECLCSNCDLELEENTSEPCLFYDEYSHRYFETTIEKVLMAEYHLNRNFTLRGCSDLNELYEFLGLELTDYGSTVGWSVFNGDDLAWIDFNHRKIELDDGLECYILEMPFAPTPEGVEDY